jgi:hypothetical protein
VSHDREAALTLWEHGVEPFVTRPSVLGATFRYRPCPDHYGLDLYLLAHPAGRKDAIRLVACRPSGTVVHAGEVVLGKHGATGFTLDGCNPPFSRPLRVHGVLEHGAPPRLGEAVVASTFAGIADDRRPRQPVRAA